MGNTVISSILFQPPSPPNVLDIPSKNGPGNTGGGETTLANKRYANLSIDYLWIYSKNNKNNNNSEEGGEDEYNLIPAIHIQHKSSNNNPILAQTQKYTLLYSHGNAEDIGLISSFLIDLARLLQVNVICYDYSGYGISIEESTYVSQFYNVYGREINAWKLWCKSFGGLEKHRWEQTPGGCRYSRDVFVAPIIHPNEGASGGSGGGMDELMFSTSYVNEERVVQEEESGGACDFSNACGDWSSPTPPPHNHHQATPYERSISSSSTRHSSFNNMDMSGSSRHRTTSQHRHSHHHNSNLLNSHTWSVPTPSEENCYANISSVYSYLTSVEGIPSKHIILYGKSVGSGPTCWLAQQLCQGRFGCNDLEEQDKCSVTDEVCFATESREPIQEETRTRTTSGVQKRNLSTNSEEVIGGVVLHSPFLSVIRVVFDVGFTTVGDLFPNIDRVGDLTCPVYVIHGSNDEVVPFYHGETLFQTLPDKAKTVPFWARGAGHNNIEMDMPTAFVKRLQQFIRQCDRLNYPNQLSPRKQAKLQQIQAQEQQQNMMMSSQHARTSSMHHLGHSPSTQYDPRDSYHNVAVTPPQIKPSKQRKKKGTLVMRSTHNQMQVAQSTTTAANNQIPLPPPPTSQRWSPRGIINSSRSQGMMTQQQQYVSSSTNHGRQYSRSVSDSYSPSSSPSYQPRKFMLQGKKHQPQQQQQQQLHRVQEQQYDVSRGYRE